MKLRSALLLFIGLLALAALACAQAGEILTPAEATARAAAPQGDTNEDYAGESVDSARLQPGDQALLTGRSFLVNLYNLPAGRIIAGQERGVRVEILETGLDDEGDVWYRISAPTGEGWVPGTDLETIVAEEGEEAADDGAEESSGEPATGDIQVGDTVVLTARGFLVNIINEAGGNRIIANQERGVEVRVLDVQDVNGTLWYLIDAPTGEGWVPVENVELP